MHFVLIDHTRISLQVAHCLHSWNDALPPRKALLTLLQKTQTCNQAQNHQLAAALSELDAATATIARKGMLVRTSR